MGVVIAPLVIEGNVTIGLAVDSFIVATNVELMSADRSPVIFSLPTIWSRVMLLQSTPRTDRVALTPTTELLCPLNSLAEDRISMMSLWVVLAMGIPGVVFEMFATEEVGVGEGGFTKPCTGLLDNISICERRVLADVRN